MKEFFNPSSIKSFAFRGWNYNVSEQTAYFHYSLEPGYVFEEQLKFVGAPTALSKEQALALKRCFNQLSIALGMSYFKAAVPSQIKDLGNVLDASSSDFFSKLYRYGLSEFFYTNHLPLDSKIEFPVGAKPYLPTHTELKNRILVPIGGGKDSLVTVDLLKKAGKDITLFSFGDHQLIHDMAKDLGFPYINVQRKMDPLLFEINEAGALNGHVPISAIIAFVLTAVAVLHDYDTAIVSHESSSSDPNFFDNGNPVNHQYSKSLEFEIDFQNHLKHFLPEFTYFSLLRGMSELAILRRFSELSEYHSTFSSCNANFRITKEKTHWCGNCPKCRFTFIGLSAFLSPDQLTKIFGKNLLAEHEQEDGFDALLGWGNHKPFECVGTHDEVKSAFFLTANKPEWQDFYIVKRFIELQLPEFEDIEEVVKKSLADGAALSIPDDYEGVIANAA